MVSALGNGVKGGRWYGLMDKVYAPATLSAAWRKVRAKGGAAGVAGQSIERFAARAEEYLCELGADLRTGSYRAQPIRRVEIPKGDGQTRPLGIPTVKDRIAQAAVCGKTARTVRRAGRAETLPDPYRRVVALTAVPCRQAARMAESTICRAQPCPTSNLKRT